MQSEAQST